MKSWENNLKLNRFFSVKTMKCVDFKYKFIVEFLVLFSIFWQFFSEIHFRKWAHDFFTIFYILRTLAKESL